MENNVPRCDRPGLSIIGRLLAEVSTPPVALLDPGPEAPSCTQHLALYGLDGEGYAITRREYVAGQEQSCTVQIHPDAERVRQALRGSSLERALLRLSPVHVVEGERIGDLMYSVADVRCSTWAAILHRQALPHQNPWGNHWGYGREWENVMRIDKGPADFASLEEIREELCAVLGQPGASLGGIRYPPGSQEDYEDEMKYHYETQEFEECMDHCARVWWYWQQEQTLHLIWNLRLAGPVPARR